MNIAVARKSILAVSFFLMLILSRVWAQSASPITEMPHYDAQGRLDYVEYFRDGSTTPFRTEVYYYDYGDRYDYVTAEFAGPKGELRLDAFDTSTTLRAVRYYSHAVDRNGKTFSFVKAYRSFDGNYNKPISGGTYKAFPSGRTDQESYIFFSGTNKRFQRFYTYDEATEKVLTVSERNEIHYVDPVLGQGPRRTEDAERRYLYDRNGEAFIAYYRLTDYYVELNGSWDESVQRKKIEAIEEYALRPGSRDRWLVKTQDFFWNEFGDQIRSEVQYFVEDYDGDGRKDDNDILLLRDYNTGARKNLNVSFGDVNDDGRLSAADASTIRRHVRGISKLEGSALYLADVNQDGDVSDLDCDYLHSYNNGNLSVWPPLDKTSVERSMAAEAAARSSSAALAESARAALDENAAKRSLWSAVRSASVPAGIKVPPQISPKTTPNSRAE